jgi:hypothetical protein
MPFEHLLSTLSGNIQSSAGLVISDRLSLNEAVVAAETLYKPETVCEISTKRRC